MRNKTLVRVVTLLLVALMVLTTFAPAFTAYAAEGIEIITQTSVRVSYEQLNDTWGIGDYYFKITQSDPALKVEIQKPGSEKYEEITLSEVSDDKKSFKYEEVTFESLGTAWQKDDEFSIHIDTLETGGSEKEPQIVSSTIHGSSRITRGHSIDLDLTILDTNFNFSDAKKPENTYIAFKQGAFRKGTSAATDTISSGEAGVGGKVQFTARLNDLVYTGSGDTVEFIIGYTIDNQDYRYEMSIQIPGCIPYVDNDTGNDDDDEDVELDPLTPHIIVSQYDYGDAQVSAGNTIDLALTISNTSRHYDLDNIVMKITTGDGFAITSSSNTYYFDSLNVNENITKTISLQASPSAEAQSYPINIEFSFQYIANDKRVSGTSSESISIPVTQLDRFSVNEIQTPTSIYVGDEYEVSVNFVNLGKNVVYNVTAQLEGNMQNSGERNFIGNVASGTEDSADFYITPTQAGTIEGQIVISYEDSNMNVKQVSKPFTIQVDEYPVYDTGFDDMPVIDPVPQEPESPFTLQNILLFLVFAGVTGATGYMTVLRIKAKRSEFDDEDL